MDTPRGYRPIACDFHDQLESFATLRRRVRLSLSDGNGETGPARGGSAEGRIADIYTTPDKQEFLRLEDGAEIRLDRILAVTPLA